MKKKFKIIGVLWCVGAFLATVVSIFTYFNRGTEDFPTMVYAASDALSDKAQKAGDGAGSDELKRAVDKAGEAKRRLQEEREQLSREIADIKLKKNNIVAYIQELDGKSTNLSEMIEQNQKEIKSVRSELNKITLDKIDAMIRRDNQYDTMKRRIRYLYENGNDEYLQILLESKSLSDLYSRAEYVSKVTEYDNMMLTKYQDTCEAIKEMQLMAEHKLSELNDRKDSLKLERKSLDKLINKKTKKLEEYENKLGMTESELKDYASQIAAKENEMEELLEKQRREAAKEEAEAKKKAKEEAEAKKNNGNGGKTDNDKSGNKNDKNDNNKNDNDKAGDGKKNDNSNKNDNNAGQGGVSAGNNSGAGYRWPLNVSGVITSYFGYRTSPTAGASSYHKGIDISVPTGTTVVAAGDGTVITAAYSADAGNYICISHGDGAYTYYMHCSSLSVKAGAKVSKGQAVALSGSTGISTGPHLHFAIYKNGTYVNPLDYVSR